MSKIAANVINTMSSNSNFKVLTVVHENGTTETLPIYTDLDRIKKEFPHVTVFTDALGERTTTDIMYGDDNSVYQFVEGMIVHNSSMTGKDIINDGLFRNACDNLTDFAYIFVSEFKKMVRKIDGNLKVTIESDDEYADVVIMKVAHPKFGSQRFALVKHKGDIHYMTYMIMDAE